MNKIYDLYISEIKNNILAPEEESRLIKVYQERQAGWQEAKDKVIKSNLMFVVKVAFEFTSNSNQILDLIAEGNIALLDSLDKFKPEKGVKLITYANFEIRGKMARAFINESRVSYLNIPERTRVKINKISNFIERFKSNNNCDPSVDLIAKEFDLKNHTVVLYLEILGFKNVFLDSFPSNNCDQTFGSFIEDEQAESPAKTLNDKQNSVVIKQIIDSLPARQKFIINKRFGFNGEEPQDLASIGREMDLTRERIRQIEALAIETIRNEMKKLKVI